MSCVYWGNVYIYRLQDTTERAEAAEERLRDLEATLGEERERVRALERRYSLSD